MAHLVLFILVALGLGAAQSLPPAILQNGVFNSASRFAMALPGGALAPGARFTIQGVRLAEGSSKPIVRIHSGGSTTTAEVVGAGPDRIDAIFPARVSVGSATLTVLRGTAESRPFALRVAASSPGLYLNPGIRARAGESVTLDVAGPGISKVMVGSIQATGVVAGPTKVRFVVPRNVPVGCYVPVYAVTKEGLVSNVVTLQVGATCPPAAGRFGTVIIARASMLLEFQPGDPRLGVEERAASWYSASESPVSALPPAGTCTGFASQYLPGASIESVLQIDALDASPTLQVTRNGVTRSVRGSGNLARREPFLGPGPVRVSTSGWDATLNVAESLVWKNRDTMESITRAQGTTIEWSHADPKQPVLLTAVSVDRASTAAFAALCVAPPGQNGFHIPPDILANLPASVPAAGPPLSLFFVMQSPTGGSVSFSEAGRAMFLGGSGRSLLYR